MRRAFAALLLAGLGAGARPPLTSSSGRSQSAQEDGYGSQLLSAVLMNDLDQADAIFSVATGAQSVRLANAIDWRGKTVLMHAASRDFADGHNPFAYQTLSLYEILIRWGKAETVVEPSKEQL